MMLLLEKGQSLAHCSCRSACLCCPPAAHYIVYVAAHMVHHTVDHIKLVLKRRDLCIVLKRRDLCICASAAAVSSKHGSSTFSTPCCNPASSYKVYTHAWTAHGTQDPVKGLCQQWSLSRSWSHTAMFSHLAKGLCQQTPRAILKSLCSRPTITLPPTVR